MSNNFPIKKYSSLKKFFNDYRKIELKLMKLMLIKLKKLLKLLKKK